MPTTKLQKWGNSQGVRLPKETLSQANIESLDTAEFDIEVIGTNIMLKPKVELTPFEQLFVGYDESHPKIEFNWDDDEPVGKEIW